MDLFVICLLSSRDGSKSLVDTHPTRIVQMSLIHHPWPRGRWCFGRVPNDLFHDRVP